MLFDEKFVLITTNQISNINLNVSITNFSQTVWNFHIVDRKSHLSQIY